MRKPTEPQELVELERGRISLYWQWPEMLSTGGQETREHPVIGHASSRWDLTTHEFSKFDVKSNLFYTDIQWWFRSELLLLLLFFSRLVGVLLLVLIVWTSAVPWPYWNVEEKAKHFNGLDALGWKLCWGESSAWSANLHTKPDLYIKGSASRRWAHIPLETQLACQQALQWVSGSWALWQVTLFSNTVPLNFPREAVKSK